MKVGDLVQYIEGRRWSVPKGKTPLEVNCPADASSGLIIQEDFGENWQDDRFKIYWSATGKVGWWDAHRLEVVSEDR
jgi:hypothetical protein